MRDTYLSSSIGKPVRGVESVSNVERSSSKGKRNRELEKVQLSLMEKGEKFCLNGEAVVKTLKRKLIELFKENLRLRQDYLKHRLKSTEESGKGEMLIMFFTKLADSLNPRGWNSIRRIKLSDQAQREKSWQCEELEMRNTVFQEDRARNCQRN